MAEMGLSGVFGLVTFDVQFRLRIQKVFWWIVASEGHRSMELGVDVKRSLPRPSVRPSSGPTASTAVTVPSTRRVDEASDVPSDAEYVPAPWIPVYDDGPLYYWNEETGESSWEHPNRGKSDAKDDSDENGWWFGETVGGEAVWARHTEETDEPPCTGWIVASEAHESMKLSVDEASDVPSDAEYVPAPWIPVYDDGPLYYWNEETGESSWEHPNCGKTESLDEKMNNLRSQLDAPNAHERNSNSLSPSPSLWQRAQDSQRHSRHDEKLKSQKESIHDGRVSSEKGSELQRRPNEKLEPHRESRQPRHNAASERTQGSHRESRHDVDPTSRSGLRRSRSRRRRPTLKNRERPRQKSPLPEKAARLAPRHRRRERSRRHSSRQRSERSARPEAETRLVLRSRSRSRRDRRDSMRSASRRVVKARAKAGYRSSIHISLDQLIQSRSRRASRSRSRQHVKLTMWSLNRVVTEDANGWLPPPLTPMPPGRQVHLPGVVQSDDGLKRWLHEQADKHLDGLGCAMFSLDCVDVSHNNLTDDAVNALVDYLLKRQQPTRRLKLFNNRLREPPSMCDLIRDGCCGIGARNGLSELHLSHNLITESMVDNLLGATGKAIAACGGRLRQPFYLRMELNSTLEGIDPKRFSEDDGKRGFKICLSAGYQKSGCNIKHCRHGADVHLILSKR